MSCPLAHVTTKEIKDKRKEAIEDGTDHSKFLEVFPEDLPVHSLLESSGSLFVKKKDGSFRMCIDYRELNKLTVITSFEYVKKIFQRRHSELDMVIMSSKNKKEHEEHLKAILELLKKEELYAKSNLAS
ncbi:hypothetical protein Tco_0571428 [Tanacetum coccineum]